MSEQLLEVMSGADAERPDPAASYRALRLIVKLTADAAMRCDDAAEAAQFALSALHAEFLARFELLRHRRDQPFLPEPPPLPPSP